MTHPDSEPDLDPPLGQPAKLDRLFAFHHRRNEPEWTTADVAERIARNTGEPVTADQLDAARDGTTELSGAVADALCDLFGVDRDYLRVAGGRDIDIDQRLRLWTAIRDRGLDHFAARATGLTRAELEELIAEVNRFPVP